MRLIDADWLLDSEVTAVNENFKMEIFVNTVKTAVQQTMED